MVKTLNFRSRPVAYSLVVLSGCFLAFYLSFGLFSSAVDASGSKGESAAPSATFPGTGVGPIPDGNAGTPPQFGAPLVVSFNVTGMTAPLGNVAVEFTGSHTWVGDVDVVLAAPGGSPSIPIVSRIGVTTATSFGDSSNYGGTYNFNDAAAGTNIWTVATAPACGDTCTVTAGSYRSTGAGGAGQTNPPPTTTITSVFSGLSAGQINGTWTLTFRDAASADTGAISAATLTLESAGPPRKKNVDFDGDGKSDYSLARDVTPALSGSNEFYRLESVREKLRYLAENPNNNPDSLAPGNTIRWFVNSSANTANNTIADFGTAPNDFLVPSDYDGDGKADIAVWRPGAPTVASFYILQSSNNTVRAEAFGQTGDDPAITGDYDGDGKSDLAVYRCPGLGTGDGQCFFYYRGSNANPSGNITFVPWGFGETFDFFVNPGDFDGDGKFDFCVQRTDPSAAGAGQFVLRRSSDNGIEYVNWGRNTDLIVPGDYDGDGKYDFMVSRTETIASVPGRSYYLLERDGGGTGVSPIRWGIAGDVRTPGDYDGDGKTDIAIWRPDLDPNNNYFFVRRSSDNALQSYEYGQNGDFAVASWWVH